MALINQDNLLFLGATDIVPRPISYTKDIHDFTDTDYWYCEFFDENSIKHFLNPHVISTDILDRIRNYQCVLMLNNAHEAFHTVVRAIYDILVKQLNLPPSQIVLISESAIIDVEVSKIANEYNLDKIKTEWMRLFEHDTHNLDHNDIQTLQLKQYTKKFLNFNRRWRLHRPTLVGLLKVNNLLDYGYVSLVRGIDDHDWDNYFKYIKWSFRNQPEFLNNLLNHKTTIENIPDLFLDQNDMQINHGAKLTDSTDFYYENTYFSIVSETNFFVDYGEGIFVSEKIFRPIIKKHPFILVSRPHTLSALKKLGYKTYEGIINENYDVEENDYIRLQLIVDETKRLCNLSDSELQYFLLEAKNISDYNYNVLINKTQFLTRNYNEKH